MAIYEPPKPIVAESFYCIRCGCAHAGDRLCEGFLARFGRYAEDAATEALRIRWGRVLAHEVRNPGGLTNRDLREIDEATWPEEVDRILRISRARHTDIVTSAAISA